MSTAKAVIAEARKHLGYVEGPKKDNLFGRWYGANNAPWCAMFVSYCMNKAGAGLLIKGAQTAKGYASCGKGIAYFKKKKAWFPVEQAQVGDHAFFDWNHDGDQDHVGIVTAIDLKKKQIKTIEGNTNDSNHSNGGTVQEKWRNFSVIMGVGRPAWTANPKPSKTAAAKEVKAKPVTTTVQAQAVQSPVLKTSKPQVKAVEPKMSATELESLPENYKPRAERGPWVKTLDIFLRLLAGSTSAFLLPFGSIALTNVPSWLAIPLAAALGWFAFRTSNLLNTYTRFGRLTERDIDANFTSIAKKK
jgi:hypothetical protein